MGLNHLRYLCFELRPECNYTAYHPWCPSAARTIRKEPLIDDETIERFIRACQRRGFKGRVGFHYYSEPMLDKARIQAFKWAFHGRTLASGANNSPEYVLWSNGTMDIEDRDFVRNFHEIFISDYGLRDPKKYGWDFIVNSPFPHRCAEIQKISHDRRIDVYTAKTVNPGPCIRPTTIELPVDCWGYIHLCCADWDGTVQIGNIIHQDHDVCINSFLGMAREAQISNIELCGHCRSIHAGAIDGAENRPDAAGQK